MGLIIDTCEFIDLERTGGSPADITDIYGSSEIYAVSIITVAELQHGVRRADSLKRMERRRQFMKDVIENFAVYPFDHDIALRLGDMDAMMEMAGQKRSLADLIVAATALELDYAVATKNLKHFDGIPGPRIASAAKPV